MDCRLPGSSVYGISQQDYGVDCNFLLQRNLPNPGTELASLYWQADSLPLSHLESPINSLLLKKYMFVSFFGVVGTWKKYEAVLHVFCLFVCLTFISEGCNDLLPLSNRYLWALICSLVPTWTLKNIRVSVYHGYSWFLKIHDSSSSWEFCSVEVLCLTYDYFTQIPSSHKQWSPEALSIFI